ncbi:MAG: membrane or secreted protein [Bacteroidota bacterium]
MKKINLFLLLIGICAMAFLPMRPTASDALTGAWKTIEVNGEAVSVDISYIFASGYGMYSIYDLEKKQFIEASGGYYKVNDNSFTITIEYHTSDTSEVGKTYTLSLTAGEDETMLMEGEDKRGEKVSLLLKRLDYGDTPLSGNWRISERMREGKMSAMRPGPRKTLKILSGTRFQWAAINPETKQFRGTGGGTYTFENGKYTENIEFFSRDSSRVGMSLEFDGSVEGEAWTHSGFSSKGAPIKEIWRIDAY